MKKLTFLLVPPPIIAGSFYSCTVGSSDEGPIDSDQEEQEPRQKTRTGRITQFQSPTVFRQRFTGVFRALIFLISLFRSLYGAGNLFRVRVVQKSRKRP